MTVLLLFCASALPASDAFKFEFDYDSRSFVESTRRDWNDYVYSPASTTPTFTSRQYDKNFMGSDSELSFALKSDLNETHYLDIKETLYFRHYNDSELSGRDYASFKYPELDHLLNITWGIAAGDHDYVQFDYFNNVLELPDIESLNYKSHRGRAQMTHEFNMRTGFSLYGAFEEREYENDSNSSFREGRAGFEVASRLPGHHFYVPVAASTRGDREYFANFPGAMSARKAIDYYTSYAVNPRDEDPRARYMRERRRGELFLRAFGDLVSREFNNLDNKYSEVSTGFETAYDAAEDLTLRLRDTYRKIDFDRESAAFFHHDSQTNYLALTLDYYYSANMAQTLTVTDELQKFSQAGSENFRLNALTYEGFFTYGRSRASLVLSALRRRYDEKRLYYPDEDEWRAVLGYDYLITETLRFRMKSEFVDRDYLEFEDYLYSTHSRNAWRIGIEKSFSRSNSLELAYQENNERNDLHTQNNIAEKSVGLSWISHY
ncbi:MAG: hypothetical protein PHD82_09440 [Candidatus Riflebacteria bacterium]|nr:hypothetical protein [Candidatus Riflebacteria bacterium]